MVAKPLFRKQKVLTFIHSLTRSFDIQEITLTFRLRRNLGGTST